MTVEHIGHAWVAVFFSLIGLWPYRLKLGPRHGPYRETESWKEGLIRIIAISFAALVWFDLYRMLIGGARILH
jgi:hypothetical protein